MQLMYEGPPATFEIRVPATGVTAEALQKAVDLEPAPEDATALELSTNQFVHLLKAAQELEQPESERFMLPALLEELNFAVLQKLALESEAPQKAEKPEETEPDENKNANPGEEGAPAAENGAETSDQKRTHEKSAPEGAQHEDPPAEEV